MIAYFCSLILDPILLSGQTEMVITFSNPLIVLIPLILNSLIVKMNEEPGRKQSKKLTFETSQEKEMSKAILCH